MVEFSKRDNCFKGYFLSCRRKEGLKVYNLSQCISIEDTGKVFDSDETEAFYEAYREQQMDKVEIEFDDRPGLADRVLTEFSPWKKAVYLFLKLEYIIYLSFIRNRMAKRWLFDY